MSTRLLVLAVVAVVAVALCGCGGGGGTGGRDGVGALHFSVKFPPLPAGGVGPAYLPPALNSLVIEVFDPGPPETPKCDPIIINRPSPEGGVVNVNIPDIHIGNTRLRIRGYDGLDGTGTVICDAKADLIVYPNDTADVNMTMATTVVRIEVSGPTSVLIGSNVGLYATGYDVDDNIVLTASFNWSSLNDSLATVDELGQVTGVARGDTQIKVEEAKGYAPAAYHDMAVNPAIDRVEITTVGDPFLPASIRPAGGTPTADLTLNIYQLQKIVAKCYVGNTEITDVPITFTSDAPATVSVTPDATDSPDATLEALLEGGPVTITATQPYTPATAKFTVQVTATGGIDVHIN